MQPKSSPSFQSHWIRQVSSAAPVAFIDLAVCNAVSSRPCYRSDIEAPCSGQAFDVAVTLLVLLIASGTHWPVTDPLTTTKCRLGLTRYLSKSFSASCGTADASLMANASGVLLFLCDRAPGLHCGPQTRWPKILYAMSYQNELIENRLICSHNRPSQSRRIGIQQSTLPPPP